jgi:hypothetical protein
MNNEDKLFKKDKLVIKILKYLKILKDKDMDIDYEDSSSEVRMIIFIQIVCMYIHGNVCLY